MGESQIIMVGGWSAEPARNLLQRAGASIRIKPRSMEVLVYLAEHAGEVVSTEELIDAVWRGRVVGDGTVYQCITNLRQAFGDDPGRASFIETIPKRGYRLVAPVALPEPAVSAEAIAVGWARNPALIAATTVLSVLAIVAVWYVGPWSGQASDARPQPLPNSVAVMPFVSLSPDPEHEYFAVGIHESVINELGGLRNAHVIARSSVMNFERVRISDIADNLRVESVMEGSVRYARDRVRVTVQLIDAGTETQLWADEYEGSLSDVFAFQADIATKVATALEAEFFPQEAAKSSTRPTQSTRAADFYLSGLDYFNRPDDSYTPTAVQQFERAVDEDPAFGLAWAALARAHMIMYLHAQDPTDERAKRLGLAKEAIDKALVLSPHAGEPHLALAVYHAYGRRDYPAALAALAVAEQRMPGRPEIFETRSYVQRRANEWVSAVASMARAIELDPRNIDRLGQQAGNHLRLRNYEQAESYHDRILELAPDHGPSRYAKAFIPLARDGDVAPAKAAAEDHRLLGFDAFLGWDAALYDRDYDLALSYVEDAFGDLDTIDDQVGYYPRASETAVLNALAGRAELARAQFEIAHTQIQTALRAAPDDARLHVALGEALVGLGQPDLGVRAALHAIALAPRSVEAILGAQIQYDAIIRVFGPAGDVDLVVEHLDDYLSAPAHWYSIEGLLPHPHLDRVRDDARFQALVAKYRR